jgi:hypothetical protein
LSNAAAPQNLRAALATQAPPSNPKTPNDRTDPGEQNLLDQQRIRRSFEVAIEHRPDDQDPLKQLYTPMLQAITRLRDGTPQQDVIDALGLAFFSLVSPQTKTQLMQLLSPPPAPGMGAMPGMPPQGGPPGAGPGATAGGPPPGGPPVAPGPPG